MRDERRKFFSWVLERRTNVWILKKERKTNKCLDLDKKQISQEGYRHEEIKNTFNNIWNNRINTI